jgi:hypothetical protein
MHIPRILKRGSRGRAVRFLQILINTRHDPKPKLRAEGVFGFRTEAATKEFQVKRKLTVDGIVGPLTWAALKASGASRSLPAPHVRKFLARLGTAGDFVGYVKGWEDRASSRRELFDQLSDSCATSTRTRFLIVRRHNVGVIDFRHFFTAAGEAYSASRSEGTIGTPSSGKSLLLGVGSETLQCGEELKRALHIADAAKIESCFSREDLASNRLGGEFGRLAAIAEAERSPKPVHEQLRGYMHGLWPLSLQDTEKIKMPANMRVALEVLAATLLGLYDVLVPDAY